MEENKENARALRQGSFSCRSAATLLPTATAFVLSSKDRSNWVRRYRDDALGSLPKAGLLGCCLL